jgi:hypothetical protein
VDAPDGFVFKGIFEPGVPDVEWNAVVINEEIALHVVEGFGVGRRVVCVVDRIVFDVPPLG